MDNPGLPQGTSAQSISLWFGHPDPTTLNTPPFQEAVQRVMTSPQGALALAYGNEQGNLALIDYLVSRINHEQNLSLTADNMMITAGSTSAMDMITRLYAKSGRVVLVEAPSYVDTLHVFRDHGVTLYSVPMDQEGIIASKLEKLLQYLSSVGIKPAFLYTIPNFHNPTGISASEGRRAEIVRVAQQHGLMIVEDDVYRDLAFEGSIPSSYLSLMNGVNVIQVGSVSKTIAPGLRVGWIAAAPDIIRNCVDCGTAQMGGGASPLAAQIVAEYCRSGHIDAHLEHIRDVYRTRRDTLLAALSRHMPPDVQWTTPAGGFFVWVTLPDNTFGAAVKAGAIERGVIVAAGEGYFVNRADGAHNLRLAFSFASLDDMDTAVRILAEVIAG